MLLLIYITMNIKTVINAIVNNAVTLQLMHQTDAASNHSHPVFFLVRLAAPDVVMKCIEARAVHWPEVWKFYRSLTLLHFRAGSREWCPECHGRHSSRKR